MAADNIINTIIGIVLGLVVLGFIIGTGVLVLEEYKGTLTTDSVEHAAVANMSESLSNTSEQFPVFGTVVGVMAILLLVLGIVYYVRGRVK